MNPELASTAQDGTDRRKELSGRSEIVFLVPAFVRESVSFICFQYVTALRQRGWNAAVCAVRQHSPAALKASRAPLWRAARCDVLITNLFLPDLIGYLLARIIPGIRWLPFVHCDIVGGLAADRKPLARLKIMIWRAILTRAPLVLAPSRYALRNLREVSNAEIIPHCIVPDIDATFRSVSDLELGDAVATSSIHSTETLSATTNRYVFIGRDTRGKRLRSILRILKLDPAATVKIIGPIDYSRTALKALAPQESARCRILGPRLNPYDHVEQGELVVCPSGREGFGMVPIECLARRIPVAVFEEGVFRELYKGTGLTYRSYSTLHQRSVEAAEKVDRLNQKFVGEAAISDRVARLLAAIIRPS